MSNVLSYGTGLSDENREGKLQYYSNKTIVLHGQEDNDEEKSNLLQNNDPGSSEEIHLNISKTNGFEMGSIVPGTSSLFALVTLGFLIIFIIVIAVSTTLWNSPTTVTTSTDDDSLIDSSSLTFTLYRNGYDPIDMFSEEPSAFMKYSILSTHVAVVEPYAPMKLKIYSFDEYERFDYSYKVCPEGSTNPRQCTLGWMYEGENEEDGITIECEPYDVLTIQLNEYNAETPGLPRNTFNGTALCLYVRREIRSLTDADLNTTLDAMYTMWAVNETEGNIRYGDSFHSSSYFVQAHEFNSAQKDSDHMHEGIGFLPQHIKLTNIFDESLRAINPSISIPYWDYTIDRYASSSIWESFVFQPNTFGTLSVPVSPIGWTYKNNSIEDGRIQDGRWANIKVDTNTKYSNLQNSYNTVRGTWTTNPSIYVSRFASKSPVLPSCSAFYSWAEKDDLGAFFYTANNDPHASTHGAIGGSFGCDAFDSMLDAGYLKDPSSQEDLCSQWGFYMKDLYRNNYIDVKEGCTATSYAREDINCGFECNDDLYSKMPIFLKSIFSSAITPSGMTMTGWESWRDFVCYGDAHLIFFGDHLDPSVSPSDPSFWVIHPSLERLLQAKYVSGGFDDDTWPSDPINDYVCSLSSCYEEDYGDTDYYSECCYGHYEYDQLLDFVDGKTNKGYGEKTHVTIKHTKASSDNYQMDYVYDSFQWSHCDEDFDDLFAKLYSKHSSRRKE